MPDLRQIVRFALVGCGLACAVRAEDIDIKPFYLSFDPSVRTAYQSRSRIIEDRPMLMSLTRLGVDTGNYGRFGIWMWDVSSLSGRRDEVHRRPLNEMDGGPNWIHDIDFADYSQDWKGWVLTSDLVKNWINLEGYEHSYRKKKSNSSISEWRFGQSLKNPYVTPFYLLRMGVHPLPWFYSQVGVRKSVPLTEKLAFTPSFYVENGNEQLFERRYAARPEGGHYHGGIMTANLMLELSWKLSKNFTFYTRVHQFDIVDDEARDSTKARKTANSRRDLTIGAVGVRCTF